jgi:hypothetical protein
LSNRLSRPVNRRSFLRNVARGAVGAGIALSLGPKLVSAAESRGVTGGHRAWVWQFSDDGPPDRLRSVLAANGLGIILKTHDGTDWMSRYDHSPTAVSGPASIAAIARFFEAGGVPFHAWGVVKGLDPEREAVMAAEVVSAGARSMVLDLEPSDGGSFWEGNAYTALAFGRQFRRLQPTAWLSIAPDPRPWQVEAVPVAEFATFSNEFAPQTYWDTFDNSPTKRLLRDRGFFVGAEGITPEVTLDFTQQALGRFGLPIRPVGQGTSDVDSWRRFIGHAFTLGMGAVSVWRYGTSNPAVWPLLHDTPAQVPVQPRSQGVPQAAAVRTVAPPPAQTSVVLAAGPAPESQDKTQPNSPAAQEKAQPRKPAPITIANWSSPRLPTGAAELQRSTGWPLGLPGIGPLR